MTTEVQLLGVLHEGDFNDGYSTFVKIDGKSFQEQEPKRYEKEIIVKSVVDKPLQVQVLFGDGTTEVFEPKEFRLDMENISIEIHSTRNPCAIYINGSEVKCRSLEVTFKEGEAVWVNLVLLPGWCNGRPYKHLLG